MLAIIAGVMIPAFVLMTGSVWYMNLLSSSGNQALELQSKVDQATALKTKALASERRRKRYLELSLASQPEQAKIQYRQWLGQLAESVFGPNGYVLESIVGTGLRFNRTESVGEKLTIKLNVASADLRQLNEFLYRFYDAPILHRINSLTATPIVAKIGAAEQMKPTGKLGLLVQIDALSLAEAEPKKTIGDGSSDILSRDLAAYRDKIESRNLFGLPNNPPVITTSAQPSEFEGRDVQLGITAREPDENDELKFELLSCTIDGAELTQRDPKSRSAQFTSAPLAPGEYKFKVRVTDSGFPAKSDEREFTLKIKPKEVIVTKPPEIFIHAQEAVAVAVVQDSQGVVRAWIHVRTLGKMHKLAVGETFDLDGASWKLVQLKHDSLTLEVNGKFQVYRIGDHLDRPRSTSAAPTAATAKEATIGG
jgi:hypothetical protein